MSDWRRPLGWNASTALGAAALYVYLQHMRSRRYLREASQIAVMGAVGSVAARVFDAVNGDITDSRSFWETARYLLATYGAYEAYQLVRFNLDAFRLGAFRSVNVAVHDGERLRPNSRLLLGSDWWNAGALFPEVSISGLREVRLLLAVMAAALLAERLKLRRQLNIAPLQWLGLYSLATERPVTRSRR